MNQKIDGVRNNSASTPKPNTASKRKHKSVEPTVNKSENQILIKKLFIIAANHTKSQRVYVRFI